MSNGRFETNDLSELRALQRVFREAKFSLDPDDSELSTSPVVNAMFCRVMEELVAAQSEEDPAAEERWNAWLRLSSNRDEWIASVKRAAMLPHWLNFNASTKLKMMKEVICPFNASESQIQELIEEADAVSRMASNTRSEHP